MYIQLPTVYRLQHQIDKRQAGPEECAAEAKALAAAEARDPDRDYFDQDEFDMAFGLDQGVFDDDFYRYS